MLVKYYFKIEYTKGIENAGADILSQMLELQINKEVTRAILKLDLDRIIRYNHLQFIVIYNALVSIWT